MTKFTYIITDELGIHARPAGQLVKLAKSFSCDIALECKGNSADLKKLFAVMGLGAKKGDAIVVSCDGEGEADASSTLEDFLKQNL